MAFTESFGAVGMRANDPEDLATLIPEALALQRPVVIDVPFGECAHTPRPLHRPLLRPPMDPSPKRPHPVLEGCSQLAARCADAKGLLAAMPHSPRRGRDYGF